MYEGAEGIYWFWLDNGLRAWFARDAEGHMVSPGIRVALPDETNVQVIAEFASRLERARPKRRRRSSHLQLVPVLPATALDETGSSPDAIIPPSPVPSGVSPAAVVLAARFQRPA